MKLVPADKCIDLVLPQVMKTKVLTLWDAGLLDVDKNNLLSIQDENYFIFGVEVGPSIVGAADLKIVPAHGVAKCGIYLNTNLSDLSECLEGLESLCQSTGIRKMSVKIQTDLNGILAFMKDKKFISEVRLQQHIWIEGKFLAVSEYGKLLRY